MRPAYDDEGGGAEGNRTGFALQRVEIERAAEPGAELVEAALIALLGRALDVRGVVDDVQRLQHRGHGADVRLAQAVAPEKDLLRVDGEIVEGERQVPMRRVGRGELPVDHRRDPP